MYEILSNLKQKQILKVLSIFQVLLKYGFTKKQSY